MDLLHVADEECRTLWNDLSLAYTQVKGHPALLEEIAAHYETDAIAPNHIQTLAPEEGIYTAMRVLLRPGDTIVATWPGYQSLMSVALAIGARVVPWPVREDSENGRFYFDVDDLKDIVQRERPQGCVVNFPHNPTGALPTLKEWQHIGDIVEDSGAWIFSDEMYRMLEFREEERLPSACEFSGGIALGGLSKSWGCPGLRVGWLASQNDRFLAECAAYRDYVTICSSAPAEILGIVALRQTESLTHQHRERVLKNIRTAETLIASSMPFIEWRAPRAGPIAFPKLVEGGARRYAERWVEEKGLLLLPSDLYAATTTTTTYSTTIVPESVATLLPGTLSERVRIVAEAIVRRPHILTLEEGVDIDRVVAMLIPLHEVSTFLGVPPLGRGVSPLTEGGYLSYATVIWSVRKCIEATVASRRALRTSTWRPQSGEDDMKTLSLEAAMSTTTPLPSDPPLARADASAAEEGGKEADADPSLSRPSASFGLAARLRLRGLQSCFEHVPEAVVAAAFDSSRGNVQLATKSLIESFGPPPPPLVHSRVSPPRTTAATTTVARQNASSRVRIRDDDDDDEVPWVDAGASVSSTYDVGGLRRLATKEAKLRNNLFQRATEAYRRGDGAHAKSLSRKGWVHDRKMRSLHALASDRILHERQKYLGTGAAVLDLHGQHISEAIQRAEAFLDHHRRMGTIEEVRLIAGAGKHSARHGYHRGKQNLRESLRGWLRRTQPRGSFRELKGDAEGTFVVRV
eukprot:g407.t1